MLKEFKEFIMTGNVIQFAIAVILAGAVGLVVSSFVNDVVMPVVGHFAGGMDFAELKYWLSEPEMLEGVAVEGTGSAIRYGAWINTIINLIIVGFVLFMMAKAYKKAEKKKVEETPALAGPTMEELLTEIRDNLKK